MISFPNAKINIGLNITEKRPDDYHNLESCFYPVGWCDVLEINRSNKLSFDTSGIAIPSRQADNLCLRAYHLLQKTYDLPPVSIHLHKTIPIGAGLGGGSSDGASALKMLNELFELELSTKQLEQLAGKLGSDCPFFIQNTPKYVTGTGDILGKISLGLSQQYIVIIVPEVHISTVRAYAQILPKPTKYNCKMIAENQPLADWKNTLSNDFESVIFADFPEIEQLKNTLYQAGAKYASMTGSGAAVYGIFEGKVTFKPPEKSLIWQGSCNNF